MEEELEQSKNSKIKSTKYIPPPFEVPLYGALSPKKITYLGKTSFTFGSLDERKIIFGIKKEDRLNNMFILGAQGIGKSKLLETMLRQDIQNDYGVMVFDFNKDLFYGLLESIPQKRVNDVCILDFWDENHLPNFNPLYFKEEKLESDIFESLLRIFPAYFGEEWNSALKFFCGMLIKTILISDEEKTIFNFKRIFDDKSYRKFLISKLKDENLKNFWINFYPKIFTDFQREIFIPFYNFLNDFFENEKLKIIFQSKGEIYIEDLISENKIILINLPINELGYKKANFIKEILLFRLKRSYLLREKVKNLENFYVYFDSFFAFKNQRSLLNKLIKDAKNYRFSFTIATDSLSKVPFTLEEMVFNSFMNIVVFRLNSLDATRVEKEFTSLVKAKDLLSLNKQEFYIKMNINNVYYELFSGETLNLSKKGKIFAEKKDIYEKSKRFFIKIKEN